MSKETMSVMDYVREYLRAESDIAVQDVLSIIKAQDETNNAIATVMAIVKED